ncbi:MAG: rhodanese-like domain-containing protein [Eubacteriales bacterium]
MFKRVILILSGLFLIFVAYAEAGDREVKLIVNGQEISVNPAPYISDGRVFVPVRDIAEKLGARVNWDDGNSAVLISQDQGDSYLKGQNNVAGGTSGISNNLISAKALKDILDEDKDNDLADHRQGHSGGDSIANDPLIVDVRKEGDYNTGHIPGAVWIAGAEKMAESQNIEKLKNMLQSHVAGGGKDEIVVYCYTGNTSGLLAGVLGAQGLKVKNMMYGFDIAWAGKKTADASLPGAVMETRDGDTKKCGG